MGGKGMRMRTTRRTEEEVEVEEEEVEQEQLARMEPGGQRRERGKDRRTPS